MNNIVAILVDGGFFLRRAKKMWGEKIAKDRASELINYCYKHLENSDKLYRIFYYDCPPLDRIVYHPLLDRNINLGKTELFQWMCNFHSELKKKRKVALRMGKLSNTGINYNINYDSLKKVLNNKIQLGELNEIDFSLNTKQKGVDMRIGLDIASIAYKKQATQIILISGDSDFVPAAKLARREGIDFILDPMRASISEDLEEHIDGIMTPKFNENRTPHF